MAIQSQIYKAPSLPKMGKNSSPLNSSSQKIDSVVKGPDLKTSKMSFIKGLGISIITAESLKTVEKPVISTNTLKIVDKIVLKPKKSKGIDKPEINGANLISSELAETNSILVEIQKQLALDFAARIEERKDKLAIEKKKIRTKKLGEKEKFVEKGKDSGSGIKGFVTKAVTPIKGIFDKIIEFLTLVGTGILVNSVWKWLQDKENRDKVIAVFAFLKNYWKEIFFTILTLAVIKKIVSLIVFANRLRKLFNLFRGNKPGGGKGGGLGGGCGPVLGCVTAALGIGALTLTALAAALLGKGLVAPPVTPGLVAPPIGQPVNPIVAPDPTYSGRGEGRRTFDPNNSPIQQPEFSIPTSVLAGLVVAAGVGAMFVPIPGMRPVGATLLSSAAAKITIATAAAAILTNSTLSPVGASELPSQKSVEEGINKYNDTDKDELVKLYKNEDTPLAERMAAESILKEKHSVLEPQKLSRGGIIPGAPSMQDTIHALLAKGEFVMNSMSTKMFKPFLYAINNNAGRLFKQFIEGVNLMKKNNELSEELTKIQFVMVKKLNKQVEELVEREREKKRKELERVNLPATGGGTSHPNSTQSNSNQSLIEPKFKPIPIEIKVYRGRTGGGGRTGGNASEGSTTILPLVQPPIDVSAQQTPDETPTQVSEKSQSSITIRSTDSSNPYIANSYVNYGIDV